MRDERPDYATVLADVIKRKTGAREVDFDGPYVFALMGDGDDAVWVRYRLDSDARAFLNGEHPELAEPLHVCLLPPDDGESDDA